MNQKTNKILVEFKIVESESEDESEKWGGT